MIPPMRSWQRWLLAFVIGLVGLGLRLDAAARLPIDADEDTYINNALHYSWAFLHGDWREIYRFAGTPEHPILNKLAYSAVLMTVEPVEKMVEKDMARVPVLQTGGRQWILAARRVAASLGGLGVFFLALVNPAAGLLLAFQTTGIKFTSEIYLEALPLASSLLVMMTYTHWQALEFGQPSATPRSNSLWLLASGLFLGMTAAGKYIYCVAGLAVIADFLIHLLQERRDTRRRLGFMLAWGLVALIAFFCLDPILWSRPLQRLSYSIHFFVSYDQGGGYPWWYSLHQLVTSVPQAYAKYQGIFYVQADVWIALAGVAGFLLLWKRLRPYALWLGISLAFSFLWKTKWDQYILIILPGLCLSAGEGITWAAGWVVQRVRRLCGIGST